MGQFFLFCFRQTVQMQTVSNQPARLVNMALFFWGTFPKQHWICRNCNNRSVSLSLDCLSFVLAFQFPMHKGWWSLGLLLYITYQRKRYVSGPFAAVNELFPKWILCWNRNLPQFKQPYAAPAMDRMRDTCTCVDGQFCLVAGKA